MARTSSAAASQASSLRLAMITSAPAFANARTICRPSPRLPPVTSATLPERSKSSSFICRLLTRTQALLAAAVASVAELRAAVAVEDRAGDVFRGLADQEHRALGHLVDLAIAAQRDAGGQRLGRLLGGRQPRH